MGKWGKVMAMKRSVRVRKEKEPREAPSGRRPSCPPRGGAVGSWLSGALAPLLFKLLESAWCSTAVPSPPPPGLPTPPPGQAAGNVRTARRDGLIEILWSSPGMLYF